MMHTFRRLRDPHMSKRVNNKPRNRARRSGEGGKHTKVRGRSTEYADTIKRMKRGRKKLKSDQ